MQNSDYLSVFCHLLLPVAYEVSRRIHTLLTDEQSNVSEGFFIREFFPLSQFCPDLVLVCAGFDSAIGDPEVLNINYY